jgi:hypothetical protein
MTAPRPPRLALALLDRFFVDDEGVVGDLVEEFAHRRSRTWFWRQTVSALVLGARRPPREVRPLELVEARDRSLTVRADRLAPSAQRPINLTASPLNGVSGLSLVLFAALITVVAPGLWWIALLVVAGGVALGVIRVLLLRRRDRTTPAAGQPNILFGGDAERRARASGHGARG